MGFMHLAIGQSSIILGDVSKNLEIMEKMIIEAQDKSDSDIDLIVFPELFITGYNLRDNYSKVAEKIPSSAAAQNGILELAKKFKIHIITGIVERSGKSLFNSAIIVGPEGYIGHYQKRFLPNFGPPPSAMNPALFSCFVRTNSIPDFLSPSIKTKTSPPGIPKALLQPA